MATTLNYYGVKTINRINMKKILIILTTIISLGAAAQEIQGFVLNFGLQKRDAELMAFHMKSISDSTYRMFLKFQDAYKASPSASASTVLTIDTVSTQALFELYKAVANDPNYVAVGSVDRVENAIEGTGNAILNAAIATYVASLTTAFNDRKLFGRFLFIGRKN